MKLRSPWRKKSEGWTCKKIQLFCRDYVDDELSVCDKFDYEAHVATCERCRNYIGSMLEVIPAIAEAARQPLRARVARTPIPQKIIDAAERLPIEGKLRLIEFAPRSAEEERLREERRRRREMERERMKKAKPN